MPRASSKPASKPKGRPSGQSSRKTATVRLEKAHLDWFYKNVSRDISLSTFLNEAMAAKIETWQRR